MPYIRSTITGKVVKVKDNSPLLRNNPIVSNPSADVVAMYTPKSSGGSASGGNTTQNYGSNVNVSGQVNTNGLTAAQIQAMMNKNSSQWTGASTAERDRLHNENLALSKLLGSDYNPATGTYSGGTSGNTAISSDQIIKAMKNNGQSYANTTDDTQQDALHSQNEYLANAFGLNGAYNPTTGVWNLGQQKPEPQPQAQPNTFQNTFNNSMGAITANGQDTRMNNYEDTTNQYAQAATNPTDPYWDNIRKMAESLGSAEYLGKKQSFQNLLSNLTAQQKSDLDAIMAQQTGAQNDIKNKTFQDWLQARQNLSSRGLSGIGSGFQQDADTRLQLNQQNALGDLFASVNQNIGKTNAQYGEKLSEAQQQLAGLNLTDLQQKQFQDMFGQTSGNLLEMAKMYADLTGKQMPYAQFQGKDLLDSNFNYDKLNTEDRQFYAKLDQDYGLKMADMMGVDAQGNPTLDTTKFLADIQMRQAELSEKISHNRTTEQISINGQVLQDQQATAALTASIQNNMAKMKLEVEKLNANNANTASGRNASAIAAKAKELGDYLGQLVEINKAYISKDQPVPPEITKAINSVGEQYNNAITGFDVIIGSGSSTATGTSPRLPENNQLDLSQYAQFLNQ